MNTFCMQAETLSHGTLKIIVIVDLLTHFLREIFLCTNILIFNHSLGQPFVRGTAIILHIELNLITFSIIKELRVNLSQLDVNMAVSLYFK